jgi:hypothetical protein
MNYEIWKNAVESTEKAMSIASAKLQQFPKGDMGLTPKHIRDLPEFKQAKREYDTFHNTLRVLNKGQKKFIKQRANERRVNR